MKRRKTQEETPVQVKKDDQVLDVTAAMQGTLKFSDPVNLRISGKFEGILDTKGKLMIGEKAEITADISGEVISIEGSVTGNIKASRLLKMGRTSKLDGDVETTALSVQEGAILIGQVRMEKNKSTSNGSLDSVTLMDAYQVAKYLADALNSLGRCHAPCLSR